MEEPRSPQPSQTSMARKWFAKLRKKDSIDNSDSLSLIEEETCECRSRQKAQLSADSSRQLPLHLATPSGTAFTLEVYVTP